MQIHDPLLQQIEDQYHLQQQSASYMICRLCLGGTPRPINPCQCQSGYIHEYCLQNQISKQLKYHKGEQTKCRYCHKLIQYKLINQYRLRNRTQLCQFAYQNLLPQFVMCLLLYIALAMNQDVLDKIQSNSFWMQALKIYLVLVGIYLQLLFLFVFWLVFQSFRHDFLVRDYEAHNIQIV